MQTDELDANERQNWLDLALIEQFEGWKMLIRLILPVTWRVRCECCCWNYASPLALHHPQIDTLESASWAALPYISPRVRINWNYSTSFLVRATLRVVVCANAAFIHNLSSDVAQSAHSIFTAASDAVAEISPLQSCNIHTECTLCATMGNCSKAFQAENLLIENTSFPYSSHAELPEQFSYLHSGERKSMTNSFRFFYTF